MNLKQILRDGETWKGIIIILALSLVIGTVSNLGLIKKFLQGEFRRAFFTSADYPGLVFITLPEMEELWHNQKAVIVDSRPASEFRRGHVPNAISVPMEEVKSGNYGLLERLSPGQPLIIYCEGGDCLTSLNLARLLYGRGFRDLRVFSGGWAEWLAAGLPVEKEDGGY
ncbi:MAG: Transcriptional regulator, ArsR family [Candidatus Saccharicenans subterraneus]|uniref:Transcriptional regulator, ArsR family n=1 Tax=Candidatus Saccharicenans subterraneus TaxID=2508984 RepID=A0A3E2BPT0_9BACT|nr:MAG: Transcriptional regulator, ArsR family [Candidatus Saccharicenans subterraneum]